MAKDPARFVTRLRSIEAYKIRIRACRAILDVDWGQRVMYVLSVGYRSVVYRRWG